MNVRILNTEVEFFDRTLSPPLQLSTGLITQVTEARARVTVRAGEEEATGRGSIYLSDLWSWPDRAIPHPERDAALRRLCLEIADRLDELCGSEPAHPLELGLRLHAEVTRENHPPVLARALCASPFDAALHDAAGLALKRPAFEFYSEAHPIPSADPHFPHGGVCRSLSRLLRAPVKQLAAWWVVGARDSLEEVVAPAVRERGYRCFKLKILGKDFEADAQRTVQVYRFARSLNLDRPKLLADSNEANPNADSVVRYLEFLQARDREAFEALQYLEQPTGRDIQVSAYDWAPVARIKPVLLDEGLIHPRLPPFELFETARQQGWSGFALKTCKGHSFALVAAAWARERGLDLSLQDLTNPGLAAIHSALFAAHVPTLNGVELNSPQFTPEANSEWMPRLSSLFEPRGGVHRLDFSIPSGLGSTL